MKTVVQAVVGIVLLGAGIGLAAEPEIGGLVTVGMCLFLAGATLCAVAIVDAVGIE